MVEVTITHKKGIQLLAPKKLIRISLSLARSEAEKNDWLGFMVYNGRKLNLRATR